MATTRGKAPSYNFYLSCDINLQVSLSVSHLLIGGGHPAMGSHETGQLAAVNSSSSLPASAMHVIARLTSDEGEQLLALETQTCYRNASTHSLPSSLSGGGGGGGLCTTACIWNEMLTFCVKVVFYSLVQGIHLYHQILRPALI